MNKTAKIDEWALHAYVDGEVTSDSVAEIEAALAADPALARDVEDWRLQRDALKRAFDGVLEEPVPAALTATLHHGGSWRARPFLSMAAALALVMLGALGGWMATVQQGAGGGMGLAEEAIAAHEIFTTEVKHPVEVAADDSDHLQSWLSKRVGTNVRIPDLTAEGYTLLGGRLLVADDKPAAQLMYEDAARKRLTIFLTANPAKSETALRVETKGPLIACYWLSDKLGFAVAGEMAQEPMMRLARIIYDSFET